MISHPACLSQVAAIGMLMLAGAAPALAQGSDEERRACTPDVMRLCREYIPSVDRIVACLIAKTDELSPECRLVMTPPQQAQPVAAAPKRPVARQARAKTKTGHTASAGRAPTAAHAKPAKTKTAGKPGKASAKKTTAKTAHRSTAPLNLLPAAARPAATKPARRSDQAQKIQ